MVRFAETVLANSMPTILRRAAVLYGIRGEGKRWYQASLESEELIDTVCIYYASQACTDEIDIGKDKSDLTGLYL